MKAKNLIITLLVGAMIFTGASMAAAQNCGGTGRAHCKGPGGGMGFQGGPHGGKGCGGMGMGLRFLESLNLTDEQKTKVGDILKNHMDEISAKRQSIFDARQKMAEVVHGDNPSEENVRAAFKTVSAAQEDAMVLRVTIMNEVKGILTDAQKAELAQRQAQRAEKMKDRMERKADCLEAWVDGLDS